MLTPDEQQRAFDLLYHSDPATAQLGWTLLQPYPSVWLPEAVPLFLMVELEEHPLLRQAIFNALVQYLGPVWFRAWRKGVALFQADSFQLRYPSRARYLPQLLDDYAAVEALFEPVLLASPRWRQRYFETARRIQKDAPYYAGLVDRWYHQLLRVDPNHLDLYQQFYDLYLYDLYQPIWLVPVLRQGLPKFPTLQNQVATLYGLFLLRPDLGVALLEAHEATHSQVFDTQVDILELYAQAGQWETFQTRFEQLPHYAKTSPTVHRLKGHLARHRSNLRDVLYYYEASQHVTANGYIGVFYYRKQQWKKAREYFERYLNQPRYYTHPVFYPLYITLMVEVFDAAKEVGVYNYEWHRLIPYANLGFELLPSERAAFVRAMILLNQR